MVQTVILIIVSSQTLALSTQMMKMMKQKSSMNLEDQQGLFLLLARLKNLKSIGLDFLAKNLLT